MRTSKEFNQQLNRSYGYQEKYRNWKGYRAEISRFVSGQTPVGSDCLLLGSGYLNDVDLSFSQIQYNSMTCVDIDLPSTLLGLKQQGLEGQQKIRSIEADVSGLPDSFFDDVSQKIDREDLLDLQRYLDEVEMKPGISGLAGQSFDTVLVSALYSQLVLPQVIQLLSSKSSQSFIDSVVRLILNFMPRFLHRLNTLFYELMKPGGHMIVWSDLLEFRKEDPVLHDLISHIGDNEFIGGFYDSYVAQYGHGISSFGMENLFERLEVLESKWLLWPFDESRTFLVKMTAGW
jgi:hypothetical protein